MTNTKHVLAFIIFSLAACFITFPLIFHLGDFITGFGDELLLVWIHNWVIHALTSGNIFTLFDANIYYPFINSLAYSDAFLTSSIIAIIPVLLLKEPVTAINFTFIFSLICLGFSVYLLSYYLTKDFFASLLSGFLVIFSPVVLSYYVHLQMLAVTGVPLAILFFLLFLKQQKYKFLIFSLLCFLLQTYNSFLPGYFILFSYLIIGFFYWMYERKKTKKIITKKTLLLFLASFILLLPIVIPYYQVSKTYHYTRDIRDAVHLSIQPEDMLYSSGFSRLQRVFINLPFNKVSQNNEYQAGFLGFIFSMLVIFVLFYIVRHFNKKNVITNSFVFIGFTGIVLSLGPVLHLGRHTIHQPFLIPLPYSLFYYFFPGFQGFRNAARWEMLFILSLAVLITITLSKLLRKVSNKKKFFIYLVLFIGVVAEFNFPMHFFSAPQVKNFPKVYSWLKTIPPDAKIIELPIYVWYMHPYVFDENMREYYSTVHFRKMVNGASGYSPQPWQGLVVEIMDSFPSEKSISILKNLGVNIIIFHKKEFDQLYRDKFKINGNLIKNADSIELIFTKNTKIRMIQKFGDDYVFKIL